MSRVWGPYLTNGNKSLLVCQGNEACQLKWFNVKWFCYCERTLLGFFNGNLTWRLQRCPALRAGGWQVKWHVSMMLIGQTAGQRSFKLAFRLTIVDATRPIVDVHDYEREAVFVFLSTVGVQPKTV
jgi:hypothetical protein